VIPNVVIIGGGFAGLNAARALARAPVRVTVVDRANHHLFQPLLYQVATAALSPAEIASPIRSVLRSQENAEVVMGEVTGIDPSARTITLADGAVISYDWLILASGAIDQYFGHPEWAALAPGLKTIEDAVEIRRRFLLAFEAAEREADPDARRALLTTVVIGAGPTGVEMAGAMAEMSRHSFVRDFRRIDPSTARVVLIEGTDRVLPGFHPRLSSKAEAELRKRGVEIRTKTLVTAIEPDVVVAGNERFQTRNVIWAAGVGASPLGAMLGAATDRSGRVRVNHDLSVPGWPEVFVAGDLAHLEGRNGEPYPGIGPVALQQGKRAGENVARRVAGLPTEPFRYLDRGTMAAIGRGAAVADIRGLRLGGFTAWLAWIFVHIYFLIGFRNRVSVLMEWAWSYLTWRQGARLITGRTGSRPAAPDETDRTPNDREEEDEEESGAVSGALSDRGV
jgi:NADH dehydrogenase